MESTVWAVVVGGMLAIIGFIFGQEFEENRQKAQQSQAQKQKEFYTVTVELDRDCVFVSDTSFATEHGAEMFKNDMELQNPGLIFKTARLTGDGEIVEE